MYEPVRLSWEVRLFLFYLFVASSYWLVRSISLTWMLWRTRTMAHPSSDGSDDSLSGAEFLKELALCSLKISAMKRAVVLTLILSALVPIGGAIRILRGVSTEKSTGPAALAGASVEVLIPFAIGISVCAALYAVYSIFEGILARRKARMGS